MADGQLHGDAPMAGMGAPNDDTAAISLSAQDMRDLLQLVAERRQQPQLVDQAFNRRARRDVALPKWNGRA
ncbi:hypothetical protein K3495_g9399 [Podosphaera aphanis]|nr:hypothetical protein K3495_g9399 [Podosphaera aphanis]